MKIAHLILTHKNPAQTQKLIEALQHPSHDFFIHLDKKTNEEPFNYLYEKENVYRINNRTKIYWAGWGTIQATLNGFAEILPGNYHYINVISGQDFPIKNAEQIYHYISSRQGTEFITCHSIDGEWAEAASRVRNYHLINWPIPGKYRLEKIINAIMPVRKFPLPYQLVGRANWFTLTQEAVKYLMQFLKEHPQVVRYFKYCWGADEFIFSTILYHSKFKDAIKDNLVYVDWTGQTKGHPRILTQQDLPALLASEKLFARKFDEEVDAGVITALQKEITKMPLAS